MGQMTLSLAVTGTRKGNMDQKLKEPPFKMDQLVTTTLEITEIKCMDNQNMAVANMALIHIPILPAFLILMQHLTLFLAVNRDPMDTDINRNLANIPSTASLHPQVQPQVREKI